MQLSDYYPLILVVAVIVGAIIALRVFFTLWGPVERRINGDKRKTPHLPFDIKELKDKPVNIRMKSGTTLSGVMLLGYCVTPPTAVPYDFRHLLKARLPDGTTSYVRLSEIECLHNPES